MVAAAPSIGAVNGLAPWLVPSAKRARRSHAANGAVTGDAASSRRIHAHIDRIMKSLGFATRESKSSATPAEAGEAAQSATRSRRNR
jgi:hypothetical protein